MIGRKIYLMAQEIVREYEAQFHKAPVMHQLSPDLKRNDFVKYAGGSDSQYLTIGEKYRLTCSPYRNRICLINDNGKRMNTLKRYFEGLNGT